MMKLITVLIIGAFYLVLLIGYVHIWFGSNFDTKLTDQTWPRRIIAMCFVGVWLNLMWMLNFGSVYKDLVKGVVTPCYTAVSSLFLDAESNGNTKYDGNAEIAENPTISVTESLLGGL